jgi:hypothetical protein
MVTLTLISTVRHRIATATLPTIDLMHRIVKDIDRGAKALTPRRRPNLSASYGMTF